MTTTLEKRTGTERERALGLGNGSDDLQGHDVATRVYQSAGERVKAVLALELMKIESELAASVGWLHEGPCTCAQCLYEMSRQRKLCQARLQIEAELARIESVETGVGA